MARDTYNVAIVGDSGKGKTYSFRNMNPDTTGVINLEAKPLPFKNNFKYYCKPNSWSEAYDKLIEYAKNDKIETVVLESFSAYIDSLLATARQIKKGFEVFNYYNTKIGELMYILKRYPKDIFVTAHTETVETEEGIAKERIFVKGREWKGDIEKDFTIVMYADLKVEDGNQRDYYFNLNSDGKMSAKTPPSLFEGENTIPNDSSKIIEELNRVFE